MALPVLDGNQSATTLSSVVTGGEHIVAHTVVSLGSTAISNITSAVSGSVVSISNFPSTQAIAGTVTANLNNENFSGALTNYIEAVSSHNAFPVEVAYLPTISGTVTANGGDFTALEDAGNAPIRGIQVGWYNSDVSNFFFTTQQAPFPVQALNSVTVGSLPAISGTVTANGGDFASSNTNPPSNAIQLGFLNLGGDFTKVSQDGASLPIRLNEVEPSINVPISGTVTVGAVPNGALTTRFGSVTTANTAQISSAVTNASRKYLLIQNVTTGSNVITVGIGFTPTTTQGIQLTAGAGITFESSYIPTGAVYVLSSVTASNFTVLEA